MTILAFRLLTKSSKKMRPKSSATKNQLFLSLIDQAVGNQGLFEHILDDNWLGPKGNMAYNHNELEKSLLV